MNNNFDEGSFRNLEDHSLPGEVNLADVIMRNTVLMSVLSREHLEVYKILEFSNSE